MRTRSGKVREAGPEPIQEATIGDSKDYIPDEATPGYVKDTAQTQELEASVCAVTEEVSLNIKQDLGATVDVRTATGGTLAQRNTQAQASVALDNIPERVSSNLPKDPEAYVAVSSEIGEVVSNSDEDAIQLSCILDSGASVAVDNVLEGVTSNSKQDLEASVAVSTGTGEVASNGTKYAVQSVDSGASVVVDNIPEGVTSNSTRDPEASVAVGTETGGVASNSVEDALLSPSFEALVELNPKVSLNDAMVAAEVQGLAPSVSIDKIPERMTAISDLLGDSGVSLAVTKDVSSINSNGASPLLASETSVAVDDISEGVVTHNVMETTALQGSEVSVQPLPEVANEGSSVAIECNLGNDEKPSVETTPPQQAAPQPSISSTVKPIPNMPAVNRIGKTSMAKRNVSTTRKVKYKHIKARMLGICKRNNIAVPPDSVCDLLIHEMLRSGKHTAVIIRRILEEKNLFPYDERPGNMEGPEPTLIYTESELQKNEFELYEDLCDRFCVYKNLPIPPKRILREMYSNLVTTDINLKEQEFKAELEKYGSALWLKIKKILRNRLSRQPKVGIAAITPKLKFLGKSNKQLSQLFSKLDKRLSELKPAALLECFMHKMPFPKKDYYVIVYELFEFGVCSEQNLRAALEIYYLENENTLLEKPDELEYVLKDWCNQLGMGDLPMERMKSEILPSLSKECLTTGYYWRLLHTTQTSNLFWNSAYKKMILDHKRKFELERTQWHKAKAKIAIAEHRKKREKRLLMQELKELNEPWPNTQVIRVQGTSQNVGGLCGNPGLNDSQVYSKEPITKMLLQTKQWINEKAKQLGGFDNEEMISSVRSSNMECANQSRAPGNANATPGNSKMVPGNAKSTPNMKWANPTHMDLGNSNALLGSSKKAFKKLNNAPRNSQISPRNFNAVAGYFSRMSGSSKMSQRMSDIASRSTQIKEENFNTEMQFMGGRKRHGSPANRPYGEKRVRSQENIGGKETKSLGRTNWQAPVSASGFDRQGINIQERGLPLHNYSIQGGPHCSFQQYPERSTPLSSQCHSKEPPSQPHSIIQPLINPYHANTSLFTQQNVPTEITQPHASSSQYGEPPPSWNTKSTPHIQIDDIVNRAREYAEGKNYKSSDGGPPSLIGNPLTKSYDQVESSNYRKSTAVPPLPPKISSSDFAGLRSDKTSDWRLQRTPLETESSSSYEPSLGQSNSLISTRQRPGRSADYYEDDNYMSQSSNNRKRPLEDDTNDHGQSTRRIVEALQARFDEIRQVGSSREAGNDSQYQGQTWQKRSASLEQEKEEFDSWMTNNSNKSASSNRKAWGQAAPSVIDNPPFVQNGKTCKVAIAPCDYPKTKVSEGEADMIRSSLLARMGVQHGIGPRFIDSFVERGAVVFECEDQLTVSWLWVNASTITPWRNANLKPIAWGGPLIEISIDVPKMLQTLSPKALCERLSSQNPGLSTADWTSKPTAMDGSTQVFNIDEKSLDILKSLDFRLFLGFSRVKVRVPEN